MNRRIFLTSTVTLPFAGTFLRALSDFGHSDDRDRLGASTACLAEHSLLEAVSLLDELGFSTVEIIAYTGASHSVGLIPGFDYHEASDDEREQVYRATRAFRYISAHMPFEDIHLFSSDDDLRRRSLETVMRAMDGLAFLEGEMAVVHAGWPEPGRTYRDMWPRMIETCRMLGDYAGERGLEIGLETMQPDTVREYVGLITDIDHSQVGATVDTGHIRGAQDIGLPPDQRDSAEGLERFNEVLNRLVRELGKKTVHVHLSDVRSSDWVDHKTLGTGIIDFQRFLDSLRAQQFDGLLVLELEEPEMVEALRTSQTLVEDLLQAG